MRTRRRFRRLAPSPRIARRFLSYTITLLIPVVVLYLWVPSLAALHNPQACERWSDREVVAGEVSLVELVAARRTTAVVQVPSYMAAWPRDGIALPGLIAISDDRILGGDDMLIWHELAHQHQYRRDGVLHFLATYTIDWHRGLLAGCNFTQSYEAIAYEQEAHHMIEHLRGELGGSQSPTFAFVASLLANPLQETRGVAES